MSKRASITDVAKRAGVSISTVSLVMNNRPNVALDTARAVRDAARELEYEPGGGPGKKRGPKPGPRRSVVSRQVGIVLGGYPDAVLRDGVCTALVQSTATLCGSEGFQAVPLVATDPEQIRAMVRHARFDGLLAVGPSGGLRLEELFARIPSVQLLGSPPDPLDWDHVGFDGLETARRACRALADAGCATCWYLGIGRFVYAQLAECIEVECRHFGLEFRSLANSGYFRLGGSGPVLDCRRLVEDVGALLADSGPTPVGVFAENSALSLALRNHLLAKHPAWSAKVSAIVADSYPCCLSGLDGFCGFVDLHIGEIARQGVAQLLWRIHHRNEPRMRRLVSVSIASPEGIVARDAT